MIRLDRQTRPMPVVSIIPLVDVLLILLVFFMVTSTFLNLDMLPLSDPAPQTTAETAQTQTILVRILPGGTLAHAATQIPPDGIAAFLQSHAASRIMVLPAPQTELQALVRVLDTAASLGVTSINVVQFGERN